MQHKTSRGRAGATHQIRPRFNRKILQSALGIAIGTTLLGPELAFADSTTTELQAENERLKQELESIKKLLKAQAEHAPNAVEPPAPASESQAATAPSQQQAVKTKEEPESGANVLDSMVVTARAREEIAQDVPLPVSVVGGKTLSRSNVVTVNELVKYVPNLGVFGSNPRQTSIAIRGIGKNSAQDTLEPGVGVIVDGVVSSYVGQSWNDFNDLDRIEVLRGPQGTLLGKNTTLGAINITSKAPSFTPATNVEARVGEYNQMIGKFSTTGPLVDDLLAYRASFFFNKQDGVLSNAWQSNGVDGHETWNETNRMGGRLQFLLTPTDNVSVKVIADRTQTVENSNKSLLVSNGPATFADGVTPRTTTFLSRLQRSYFNNPDGSAYQPRFGGRSIEDSQARPQRTDQGGISATVNWDISDLYRLTSVTAYRAQDFDIKNGGVTKFDLGNGGQQLQNSQFSQEVRLSFAGNEHYDYQAGLYYLDAEILSDDPTSFGSDSAAFNASNTQWNRLRADRYRTLLRDSQAGVYRSYVLNPTTTSFAAFGQVNWHVTDKATLTLGLRDTYEHKTGRNKRELDRAGSALNTKSAADYGLDTSVAGSADSLAWQEAQALYANATGITYDWRDGKSIKDNSLAYLINPSYKLDETTLLYSSFAKGEKSGAVEFNTDSSSANYGKPQNVAPEKAYDFELGFKSVLFDKTVMFNANLYYTIIKDYQGNLTVPDATTTSGTRTYLGNIPGVRARGIEFETAYAPSTDVRFNFSGAYNDARYTEFTTTLPDVSATTLADYSGKQLHGAPRVTLSYGIDYNKPFGNYKGHFFVNNSYRSGTYLSSNQAASTYQDAYTLTDGGIGFGDYKDKWELTLIANNIFDKYYRTGASTFSSSGAITEQPGYGRTLGLAFRAKM